MFPGPRSAGVPGELKGMIEAHKLYGKLEWAELVQPSIELASSGFNVTHALDLAIKKQKTKITDPDFRYSCCYNLFTEVLRDVGKNTVFQYDLMYFDTKGMKSVSASKPLSRFDHLSVEHTPCHGKQRAKLVNIETFLLNNRIKAVTG